MGEWHRDKEKKREYDKKYREINIDRIKEVKRQYSEAIREEKRKYDRDPINVERKRERRRQWTIENPEESKRRARSTWMKRRYGITLDKYDEILESQNFVCAICGVDKNSGISELFFVDHCHSTDIVRGLLCSPCNLLLGQAKDSVEILGKAIIYLNKFQ